MRDIEVNLTEKGLEVLFDGWPPPRFERYMGNARCLFRWLRRAGRVLVIGPAQAFGLALLFGMMDGTLSLSANVTEDLHQVNLVVRAGPTQQPLTTGCQAGSPPRQDSSRCVDRAYATSNAARDMLQHIRLIYLAGVWFGIDGLLHERREKQRAR